LTSFAQDQFYRSADDTFKRLRELIAICDKKFVAQAAIYTRNEFGMRSISHVCAAELAKHVSGLEWAKDFYDKVVFRPDDMMEIVSYYIANCSEPDPTRKRGKKGIPAAMKKGFAKAFDKFNKYTLAKYRGEGNSIKLIDIVNMVHPTPVDQNREAIAELVTGDLKSFDTWETELTKAGQAGGTPDEVLNLKAAAWKKLISEQKLGYLALLRNLRNIMTQAPDVLPEALKGLTDETWIKKSMIFPFQYLTANKQFSGLSTKEGRVIADALSKAVDISCQNVRELGFSGNTCVVVDNSGSMDAPVSNSPHMNRSELGALFGIVLAKAINADIMEFGDYARYIPYSLTTHSMDFAADFSDKNKVGHGTSFHEVFNTLDKKYDRILIFSDMQGWKGGSSPASTSEAAYRKKFDANPFIYSFDLAGYGSGQFPEGRVFPLAGYSDKILSIMKALETDRAALVNEVKKVEL
jgi:hypothetical protein